MPVSKRDKKVSLTKTAKKGLTMKKELVDEIRQNIEKYSSLFVFTVCNMRNGPLKEVREMWKDSSRIFFAKKKVMAIALGRTEAEEVEKNLHKLSSQLVGQCGLFFTNKPKDQVVEWFRDYSQNDFAKAGFIATETVTLPKGPLEGFAFSMEPHLRSLGLPTQLVKGVITLREDYTVCTEGSRLTPEQASILKLFGKKMAEFKIWLVCVWSKDGSFEKFKVPKEVIALQKKMESAQPEDDANENKLKAKQKSPKNKSQVSTPEPVKQTTPHKEDSEEILEFSIQTSPGEIEDNKTVSTKNKTPEKKGLKPVAEPVDEEMETSGDEAEDSKHKTPEKATPALRRSTRKSIAPKRSPGQPNQSVKKLTESARKLKSTPNKTKGTPAAKGTPASTKKARARKSLMEDTEMK